MKTTKIAKIIFIPISGVCFFMNNYYDNLARTQNNDVYMNGLPFLLVGFVILFILILIEVIELFRN